MAALMDLTGQRFGRLVVMARASDRFTVGGNRLRYWLCECACGKHKEIAGQRLRDGQTRSCGCLRIEKTVERDRARRVDRPSYGAAHQRVWNERGKASAQPCPCGAPGEEWAYDHEDPAEIVHVPAGGYQQGKRVAYSADPAHYVAMCRPCHRKFDRWHRSVA